MRSLARVPVQLKGIFWGSDMRWFLRGAEVWLGNEYLGDVSAEWLAAAVEKELASLALSKRFQAEMEPRPLGVWPADPTPPSPTFKEEKRQSRLRRSKGRRPTP